MVNGYLATGDIAPQIIFYNGPASSGYTSARYSLYPVTATPTFKIDGLNSQVGWNQTNCQNYINSRIATPSVIDISVEYVGDASGGTAFFSITAESDPGVSDLKVWAAVLEDHDMGTSSYGVYSGQELMWEPRALPLGNTGQAVSFTGPYPQTVNLSGTYTLDPVEHTFSNLNTIAYVQTSSGNKEVLNAHFDDLPDSAAGVFDQTSPVPGTGALLSAWPNPSSGHFSIVSQLPQNVTGNVEIFDVSGRMVREFPAGSLQGIDMEEAGVYFIRMTTSTGETVSRQVAVVR